MTSENAFSPHSEISAREWVVLVDTEDRVLGEMEKLEAHEKGALHRAFSVFVVNEAGQLLLQQRAWSKYHSGGLWTNTCCSHPRPGESVDAAAERRLMEEMGMRCDLSPAFHFVYRSELDQGLVEHELDHVFIGRSSAVPVVNPEEVAGYRYADWDDVEREMAEAPERFTVWFRICFAEVRRRLEGAAAGEPWG